MGCTDLPGLLFWMILLYLWLHAGYLGIREWRGTGRRSGLLAVAALPLVLLGLLGISIVWFVINEGRPQSGPISFYLRILAFLVITVYLTWVLAHTAVLFRSIRGKYHRFAGQLLNLAFWSGITWSWWIKQAWGNLNTPECFGVFGISLFLAYRVYQKSVLPRH